MPHNTLVLYTMPDDPRAFRDHYVNKHLPLVAELPGIRSLRYTFDLSALQGESLTSDSSRSSWRMPRPWLHR